jgi:4-amino-4-deoxy-L-arabinose transferase-like glycosyltransferase
MLAAAACAWGATAAFGARSGLIAGRGAGGLALLSTEAFIAKTDAVLCGATTLAMAALARLYLASRGAQVAGSPAGRKRKAGCSGSASRSACWSRGRSDR